MKTYTFSAGEIEFCEVGKFRAFMNAMGYLKRPFPLDLIGSVRIRFEGFHPVDRVVTDPTFRRFAVSPAVADLPLCLFCDISDPAYRLMVYARMKRLSIIEQNGVFTYQPDKVEMELLCTKECLDLDRLADDLNIPTAVFGDRLQEVELYLEEPHWL